jgi:hypothetical protein
VLEEMMLFASKPQIGTDFHEGTLCASLQVMEESLFQATTELLSDSVIK